MKFRRIPLIVEAVCWNAPTYEGELKTARACIDHPLVRSSDPAEIKQLLGTKESVWNPAVIGVIDTCFGGKQLVTPGDWIITSPCSPNPTVLTAQQFKASYEPHI